MNMHLFQIQIADSMADRMYAKLGLENEKAEMLHKLRRDITQEWLDCAFAAAGLSKLHGGDVIDDTYESFKKELKGNIIVGILVKGFEGAVNGDKELKEVVKELLTVENAKKYIDSFGYWYRWALLEEAARVEISIERHMELPDTYDGIEDEEVRRKEKDIIERAGMKREHFGRYTPEEVRLYEETMRQEDVRKHLSPDWLKE